MATSYYSISHHHLADHLIYLSSSSSFWFGASWLLHCLPSHSPLVVSSQPPLVLLLCQLVFESPIVVRPSRLLAASAGCRIASRRPFVAPPSRRLIVPDGCCVDSRRAAVSSTHRAALSAIERPPPPPPLHAVFTVHHRHRRSCRRRRAVAKLPPTSRCRAAAAAAPPFVGWLLCCCPPSDFVIACRHATIIVFHRLHRCRRAAGPPQLLGSCSTCTLLSAFGRRLANI